MDPREFAAIEADPRATPPVLPPSVQIIAQRVATIHDAEPRVDRDTIASAVAEHLRVLGSLSRPLRWTRDAEEGYAHLLAAPVSVDWQERLDTAVGLAESEAPATIRRATWRGVVRRLAWRPGEELVRALAESRALAEQHTGIEVPWAAAWSSTPPTSTGIRRYQDICAALLTAFEAGLWLFWVCDDEVLAVPRPILRRWQGRLYPPNGAAAGWSGGAQYVFVDGEPVAEATGDRPAGRV
jgi:hypothetical protein